MQQHIYYKFLSWYWIPNTTFHDERYGSINSDYIWLHTPQIWFDPDCETSSVRSASHLEDGNWLIILNVVFLPNIKHMYPLNGKIWDILNMTFSHQTLINKISCSCTGRAWNHVHMETSAMYIQCTTKVLQQTHAIR